MKHPSLDQTSCKLRGFRFSAGSMGTLLGIVVAFSLALSPAQAAQNDSKQYEFTSDWFTGHIPLWTDVLAPYKGKPDVHYLEIGVYEGRSAIWMLENILTHPSSTLTGIDIFPGDLKEKYLSNLRKSGFAEKATTIVGRSQIKLRSRTPNSYDIIYIDGGHAADDVLADAVLSWELLKVGGLLIFDDYPWMQKEFPEERRPQIAIDAFIAAYRNYLNVVHKDWQVILRKHEGPEKSPL